MNFQYQYQYNDNLDGWICFRYCSLYFLVVAEAASTRVADIFCVRMKSGHDPPISSALATLSAQLLENSIKFVTLGKSGSNIFFSVFAACGKSGSNILFSVFAAWQSVILGFFSHRVIWPLRRITTAQK